MAVTASCELGSENDRAMRAHPEITSPPAKPKLLQFPAAAPPIRQLIVPREHGAWALWLFPLISGGIVGYAASPGVIAPVLWFSLLASAAFLIRQPCESLLGASVIKIRTPQEQRIAVFWVMGLTAVAALGVLELVSLRRPLILGFGLAALACFALSAALSQSRALRIPRQLVGALGLSSTSAGAYYVVTGQISRTALLLWLVNWLFAVGQIEYVQLRLHTARMMSPRDKARAGWKAGLFHLALLAATGILYVAGVVPALFALAFLPVTIRIFFWMARPFRPLKLYVLGLSELFQTSVFSTLITAAFLMRR